MHQLSVSEFSTYRWTFFQDVIKYSANGCSSIGVWRTKVEDYGLVEAVDLIHEMKLQVSSVNWAGGFTGSDGRSFIEAIDDAVDAIRLTSSLQANCLVIHPGAPDSAYTGSRQSDLGLCVEAIDSCRGRL